MTSLPDHERQAPGGRSVRPLWVGVAVCGAMLVPAGSAYASHQVMADGTMCPHAKGELAPGEAPASQGPARAAATGPLTASSSAAPAAAPRPAAKPAAKPQAQSPVQRPAQRGASSTAGSASAEAVSTVKASTNASVARQVAVAQPSRAGQPRASRADRSRPQGTAGRGTAARRTATPASVKRFEPPVTGPLATSVTRQDGRVDSSARTIPTALVVGLGLLALGGLAAATALYRRRRGPGAEDVIAQPTAPVAPTALDDPVEAELQEIIAEAIARATVSGQAEPTADPRELTGSR